MVRAVEKAGVKLCVNYNRRFAPSVLDLKAAYQSHKADPKNAPWKFVLDSTRSKMAEEEATTLVMRIQDESSSYRMVHLDPANSGGLVVGETRHWLDLVCFVMESEPVRISATGSSRLSHVITMEFADGSLACIIFGVGGTFDYPKELFEIQRQGGLFTNQCFVENQYYGLGDPVRKTYPLQFDAFEDVGTEGGLSGYLAKLHARGKAYAASGKTNYMGVWPDKGHFGLLDAFAECIIKDKPSPIDQRAGARATYLSLRAVDSIRLGHPVPVNVEDLHPHLVL